MTSFSSVEIVKASTLSGVFRTPDFMKSGGIRNFGLGAFNVSAPGEGNLAPAGEPIQLIIPACGYL